MNTLILAVYLRDTHKYFILYLLAFQNNTMMTVMQFLIVQTMYQVTVTSYYFLLSYIRVYNKDTIRLIQSFYLHLLLF